MKARLGLLLLALCLVAEAAPKAPAPASPSAQTRYPWDRRAELCTSSAPAPSPDLCQGDDWSSWSLTNQRVGFLFTIEQWGLLERALKELVPSKRVYPGGDSPASAVYWAFRSLMPAPGPIDDARRKIGAWKKAIPDSPFVEFAQARLAYASAWNARGTGGAGSVSKEAWEQFVARLREAEQTLFSASPSLKDTPLWYHLMLAIVQDVPEGRANSRDNKAEAVFAQAVGSWPRYFEFYEVRLTRLVPNWGGSWQAVEYFIDRWSRQLAATEGDSTYARLYASLRRQGVSPEQTRANWPRMKASFEELTARYPSADFRNLRASYACAARDKPAFIAALDQLALPPDPGAWLPGYTYENCLRWAGS
jgi:hypothetical protein